MLKFTVYSELSKNLKAARWYLRGVAILAMETLPNKNATEWVHLMFK